MARPSETQIESDLLLVKLAVSQGLITPEQLEAMLARQAKLQEEGQPMLLTALLVSEGLLDAAQLEELKSQGGREIGGWRLLHKLGRGGMGSVYRAVRMKDNTPAALKLLARKRARDKKYVQRFIEEARMLSKVKHPHVVRALEFGNDEGFYFFAMEFVEGFTLVDRIEKEGRVPERDVLVIGRAVCSGLQSAWEQKLIHRDIKPENILLRDDGTVKISDFGLAKDRQGGLQTTIGITFGTPHYMSPEQVRGSRDLDTRSDLYSLGATMYHALSGRFPFDGANDMEIMVKHLDEHPPSLRKANPDVSRATTSLIEWMMATDREDRPANPAVVEQEIESILEGKGGNLLLAMGRRLSTTRRRFRDQIARAPSFLERPLVRWAIWGLAGLALLAFAVNLVYRVALRK